MITRKGFTLVELIVVITILAILGTIAFISFQGYSATARDSVRTGDMGEINSSLELFHLGAGKYPETTDGYVITYTGSEVWEQGKFGETTFKSVTRLDKIPTDPLTGAEYIYSVTNNRQEYQIAGITENGEYTLNNINDSYAAGKTAILKIDGNYNGRLIKLRQPGVTYILAVPSIITSTGATLEDIIRDKMLAYDGFKNLPFNYTGGGYDIIGENQPLTVVNESDYEVFSGSVESFEGDTNLQVQFIQNLQSAYSGTDIETEPSINEIVNLVGGEEFLAQSILNNSVNKNVEIKVSSNTFNNNEVLNCLDMTQENVDNLNGINNFYIEDINGNYYDMYGGELSEQDGYNNILTKEDWCNVDYLKVISVNSLIPEIGYLKQLTGLYIKSLSNYNFPESLYTLENLSYIKMYDIQEGTPLGDLNNISFDVCLTEEGEYCNTEGGDICLNVNESNITFVKPISCATKPNYPNANFIDGNILVEGTVWQNTSSVNACYYECKSGFIGEECSTFSGTLFDRLVNYYNDNGMTISTQTQKNLIIYSGKLYFYIPDGGFGYLWYIDINGNVGQIPDLITYDKGFIEFNGNLYFRGYKADYGRELMYIDSSNNLHVIDVMIGTGSSSPTSFTIYNNKLYFSGNDGIHGNDIYYIDINNNVGFVDISPGSGSIGAYDFISFNNNLYFTGNDGVNGNELMYMDISENINTINISPSGSSSPSNKILYNNRLYFKAENRIRYIDINNNVYILDDSITNVYNYHLYNGKLYLSGNIGSIGDELLNIDLSNNISSIDIYNGINSSGAEGFVNIDNKMYILGTDESGYKQFFINTSEELQYGPMNASLLEY